MAGYDKDGDRTYVGRAAHEGELLPGKVIPNKGGAFVCQGGKEYAKTTYEVLYGRQPDWKHASGGCIPPSSFPAGKTSSDEKLYVGRVMYEDAIVVGKQHSSGLQIIKSYSTHLKHAGSCRAIGWYVGA